MRRKRICTAHLLESPEDGNGRQRGRTSWAAEGRANEAEPLVAWDGSLRYRAGECWLSVRGSAAKVLADSRASKVAPQNRNFDPVLVDEHTGTGSFRIYRPVPQVERVLLLLPPAPRKEQPL